jgi:hypothetical protein
MKEKVFIGGRWQAGGGKRKVENDSTFHLALPANVSRVMIEKKPSGM